MKSKKLCMVRMSGICFGTMLMFSLVSCRQVDEREMTVELPGVTAADTNKVASAIRSMQGIRPETIRFDLEKKVMTVRYDSMQCRRKNVEIAIAEVGFDANEIKAIPPEQKPEGKDAGK
ncbi:MAG: hypothetical protein IJR99_11080 [Kiritimatiellae bacterium]|nr:hypothetical protein [Kiritimatiellia bacterium]